MFVAGTTTRGPLVVFQMWFPGWKLSAKVGSEQDAHPTRLGCVWCSFSQQIFRVAPLLPHVLKPPVRTVTYFSSRKGKRKTVKAVIYRFLRLHSGLWLRRKAGYKKKLWKKTAARKRRLREFVFCNKTQSKLLDKMTTSFWKRRNWYADDPYQKYQDRTNLKA
ncbi:39S ribosomal protein L35, mitochondrial isoform X2 [Phacochoerus africanus]|uniref:39S ribosomal protein L35, mitochondrial isoform X2 n=1 Tax=Phacochoerus africanus TaxID=41426 RepID=UPI001FD94C3D|nr:39S ribosomal protein L35, mitochondrial isoform X2 [Phacochoerus africanus]